MALGRCGPALEAFDRHELLLHPLEHLQHRRDQVVRALVTRQGAIGDLPHELPGQDPAVGSGEDAESGGHPDRAAVLPQPAKRD